MNCTGKYVHYYSVCKRKLWLFANGITMEHTSDLVAEGTLIHEHSYPQRSAKYEEISLEGIRVDYYDPKEKVIHEIKKSMKMEEADEWQLKYYIYVFEKHGIEGCSGLLEYPVLRKTKLVELTDADRAALVTMESDIMRIVQMDECPSKQKKTICKRCSYFDFCYSAEMEVE